MNIMQMVHIKKNIDFNNKKVNLGIEILRTILCFWVLCFHSLKKEKINYLLFYITKTKFYHVPCFSFLSFFFTYNIFAERNIIKAKKRLERLLIPFILWPIIIFAIDNITNHRFIISWYQLKIQIIFGTQFMIPLWYLFSIIILTIFFFILSTIFKNKFLFLLQLLAIISYFVQYSNFYKLFKEYKQKVKAPILDTLNLLPISVFGLSFSSSRIVEILESNKNISILFSYILIYFLFKYKIFVDLGGFRGIDHIFASLFFFTGFYPLPLENINLQIKKIIKRVTSFTNGIYCLHGKMILFVKTKLHLRGTFKSCIIIYLFSYFFSFIGITILGKTKLKYLFL